MTIIKLMVTIIRTNFINRICKVVDSRLTGLQNIFQSSNVIYGHMQNVNFA